MYHFPLKRKTSGTNLLSLFIQSTSFSFSFPLLYIFFSLYPSHPFFLPTFHPFFSFSSSHLSLHHFFLSSSCYSFYAVPLRPYSFLDYFFSPLFPSCPPLSPMPFLLPYFFFSHPFYPSHLSLLLAPIASLPYFLYPSSSSFVSVS
jgi:hypothetical protein